MTPSQPPGIFGVGVATPSPAQATAPTWEAGAANGRARRYEIRISGSDRTETAELPSVNCEHLDTGVITPQGPLGDTGSFDELEQTVPWNLRSRVPGLTLRDQYAGNGVQVVYEVYEFLA